mgnify:CR=1 FL=1
MSNRKVLLMILDGWGIGDGQKGDVIAQVHPAYISEMTRKYPHAQLRTDGENVGLPDGQMGNSEVGHLNIGAGRVVYQDLVKINRACRDDSILKNPEIVKAFEYAKSNGVSVHLMGLVSDGGVHSSLDHLLKLTDIADKYGIERTYVHCFMDGRDTDPYSGKGFIERLEKHMRERSTGVVASIVGRYYAMDRDKRWERVKVAYDLLVEGKGEHSSDMALAMQKSYDEGVTDEFVKPVVRIDEDGNPIGMIRPNDVVIFFNYRPDRAREITRTLVDPKFDGFTRQYFPVTFVCTTEYDATMPNVEVAYPRQAVRNGLGEYLSNLGLTQLRIAETEKYAHVTFFFNGGVEQPCEGEDRKVIPSPKVATYDLKPEMSAPEVAAECVKRIESGKYDVVILNFANCDMVGHTGVFDAAVKAVEAVDTCVDQVVTAVLNAGGCAFITADHGNAEKMMNPDGTPFTAHTTNVVPFVAVGCGDVKLREGGCLADIAPTMLPYIGLPVPAEMTGKSIIVE